MIVLAYIYKYFLNFIYLFFKLFPTKKQVTIISRQSNSKTVDIAILEKELQENLKDVKVITLCKKIGSSLWGKLLYAFYIFKLMFYIAQSKVVVLDSYCIPISLLHHKKDLYVIQMWHAIGLMKKAGYSALDTKEGSKKSFAKAMNMHKNYDIAFASSKACIPSMCQVFNVSKEKVSVYLLPRVDLLMNKTEMNNIKQRIVKDYKQCLHRKNIVYVPTFRKQELEMQKKVEELIEAVDDSKYNLFIKLHPNSKINIQNPKVIIDRKYSSMEMLSIADYVISDYSSIIYEAGILKIPLYFYAFDFYKYKSNRGLFIDYETEVPGIVSENAKTIMKEIEKDQYDYKKYSKFINKYVDLRKKNYTLEIVNLIKKHI